jgi:microcystin-dependent protein
MTSPLVWDTSGHPSITDQVAAMLGPGGEYNSDKKTLAEVIGVLAPTTPASATLAMRQSKQDADTVYFDLYNCTTADGQVFTRDDIAKPAWCYRANPDGSIDILWAGAGANPITSNAVWPNVVSFLSATKSLLLGVPAGAMTPYAGAAAPSGWLMCDGSAVSRTTYASLFGVLSTTYGAGDGSTTFNLPDLRSRLPIGAGQGTGLTNRPLATTGGEEAHVLTVAEMPAHAHPINDPGHSHPNVFPDTSSAQGGSSGVRVNADAAGAVIAITGITEGQTGGGGAHNTVPPFLALNYIIKT